VAEKKIYANVRATLHLGKKYIFIVHFDGHSSLKVVEISNIFWYTIAHTSVFNRINEHPSNLDFSFSNFLPTLMPITIIKQLNNHRQVIIN
jgi:hypothetical protein